MRIVLDTNVLVALLVFADPELARLHAAWRDGLLVVVADESVADEFRRVLTYPRFAQRCDPEGVFNVYRSRVEMIEPYPTAGLPCCRDPDDQKFVVLAAGSGADALLTSDKALLRLRRKLRFAVAPPALFQRRLVSAV